MVDISPDVDRGAILLMYHQFRNSIPRRRFFLRGNQLLRWLLERQLRTLINQGLLPARLSEIVADPTKHQRSFAVTIDDGYADVVAVAFPVFRKYDIPATLFVVAGGIGGTNVWDKARGYPVERLCNGTQLRELAKEGMEIGSHSVTHANLTTLTDDALAREVRESKRSLEELLGREVIGFCYPYGEVDARVRTAVAAAGYRFATTVKNGRVTADTDPYLLPRLNITLLGKLENALARASATTTET